MRRDTAPLVPVPKIAMAAPQNARSKQTQNGNAVISLAHRLDLNDYALLRYLENSEIGPLPYGRGSVT